MKVQEDGAAEGDAQQSVLTATKSQHRSSENIVKNLLNRNMRIVSLGRQMQDNSA